MCMVKARGIVKYLGGFFFVMFLSLSVLLFSVYQFTSPNNMKSLVEQTISQELSKQVDEKQMSTFLSSMQAECKGKESVNLDVAGDTLVLKCSDIATGDPDVIKKVVADQFFEKVYNANYDCSLVECFTKEPMFIISSAMNSLLFKYMVLMSILSLVTGIVLFIAASGLTGKLRSLGVSFIVVGLQFIAVFLVRVPKSNIGSTIVQNLLGFIFINFLVFFVLGCILFISGLLIGILTKKTGFVKP